MNNKRNKRILIRTGNGDTFKDKPKKFQPFYNITYIFVIANPRQVKLAILEQLMLIFI